MLNLSLLSIHLYIDFGFENIIESKIQGNFLSVIVEITYIIF